ncbi:hypothetical protein X797_007211 [Metarhizium robertsii]|uniref:Uncharacterized protein n=1 Tax=Metarhizium robertsii TaxID=568076 RepID=A0A0A1UTA3_9HYPO|nr:hypothetical protein X797_007211 [Metarhizium robertsii]
MERLLKLREAEKVVGEAEVGGVWVATPNAKQHLEKRKESKPNQPKTEDDAKKEAGWLGAALTMQAAQIYARDFAPGQDIELTYGIKKGTFCQNLQRYVWIFLGQGSEEGLPWCHDPKWPKWKKSKSVHPDFTKVLYMWHNGLDIYEILEILGPISEASIRRAESLKRSKTASHGSLVYTHRQIHTLHSEIFICGGYNSSRQRVDVDDACTKRHAPRISGRISWGSGDEGRSNWLATGFLGTKSE